MYAFFRVRFFFFLSFFETSETNLIINRLECDEDIKREYILQLYLAKARVHKFFGLGAFGHQPITLEIEKYAIDPIDDLFYIGDGFVSDDARRLSWDTTKLYSQFIIFRCYFSTETLSETYCFVTQIAYTITCLYTAVSFAELFFDLICFGFTLKRTLQRLWARGWAYDTIVESISSSGESVGKIIKTGVVIG